MLSMADGMTIGHGLPPNNHLQYTSVYVLQNFSHGEIRTISFDIVISSKQTSSLIPRLISSSSHGRKEPGNIGWGFKLLTSGGSEKRMTKTASKARHLSTY